MLELIGEKLNANFHRLISERVPGFLQENGCITSRPFTKSVYWLLKGQYRHDHSRLSTGHGIGVLV